MVVKARLQQFLPATLSARFVWVTIAVEVLMFALLLTNSLRLLNQSMASQARSHAEQISPLLVAALVGPITSRDYATMTEVLEQTQRSDSINYVVVLDRSGKVIASSGWPHGRPLPEPSNKLILEFNNPDAVFHTTTSIWVAGQSFGQVQYGISLRHLIVARESLAMQGLLIVTMEVLVSGLIIYALSRLLTRQLTRLAENAQSVARGNLTPEALPESQDELGTVAKAFNTMSRAVSERHADLSDARDQANRLARQASDEHNRLLALLAAMDIGVLFLDATRRPIYSNPFFLELWGMTEDEFSTKGDLGTLVRAMQPLAGHRISLQSLFDARLACEDLPLHSGRHLALSNHQVWGSDEHGLGELWLFDDITAVKRTASQLLEAKVAADKANQAKSEFLATISHEIRTPMNGILGMTQLAMETPLSPDQKQYLQLVQTSANSLMRIINDILDFSKIEAGHLQVEMRAFELRPVLHNLVTTLAISAQAKGLRLTHNIDGSIPDVLIGDELRLRQVLTNLLGNAIKFSSTGTVHLGVRGIADPGAGGGLRIEFAVTDQGIGILPSKLTHIFDPFTQADSSTTRNFGGTGLGLAISQRLVKAMGGQITATSVPGQGSSFRFTLPLPATASQAHPPAPTPASAPPAPIVLPDTEHPAGPHSLRVLLAEDNPVNQLLVTSLLKKWGHRVVVANNGEEALSRWGSEEFDVILMDMQMPLMDGIEVTRRIRHAERETDRHVPILAMTANAMSDAQQACLDAGMDGYLPKPLHHEELRQQLLRLPV
jgi:signal transduction histidine kinase/CheY-like chemotaxis protein/HAMP domain-containing protein